MTRRERKEMLKARADLARTTMLYSGLLLLIINSQHPVAINYIAGALFLVSVFYLLYDYHLHINTNIYKEQKHMDDNEKFKELEKHAEQFLNKRLIVTRRNGSEREVEIMFDRRTNMYAFVNMTTHHVCTCRFERLTDAVNDLYQDEFVESFKFKDGGFEYVKDKK